ncbi:hypothetical protein G647_10375 [Cladophialophora carrionii CBS 160.54]|uniref:CBM1 domain-containing protein n=1 Tax=Cladophialophora carrionii CBS 160.54 TaxID=1279043 RepID=V9DI79_9EURO|nr:uncharacterized protein G647_10375 [Cladophialophora carrionii CBS 160.54]ETI26614.1 hypothetical protein G647_10375 [Cladophialophora carrionii CBS 160.54]
MYRSLVAYVLAGAALACPAASAATPVQPWGQCGGINWTGGTTCTAGWTCQAQNPYYSQCLQAPQQPATSAPPVVQPVSSATASKPASSPAAPPASTATSAKPSQPTSPSSGGGLTYKASFTHYGAGDSFGSPNCNTNTAACFFYTQPGFSAAVSQNLYGAGPGQGQGPACGTCWKLVGQTDSSGNKLSNAGTSIVVMINNLCPANGNPLCSQNGLSGTNQYGANVNFDLCSDSGASAAFFGNSGVGLAVGTATQVDCSQWNGVVVH